MQAFPGSARMAADRAPGLGVTFETICFASRRASADPLQSAAVFWSTDRSIIKADIARRLTCRDEFSEAAVRRGLMPLGVAYR